MNRELKNKIKGSIYGFAIGDAMGATTEFMTKSQIENQYGKVTEIIGGGWLDLKPGEITDDTEMMICVALAYKEAEQEGMDLTNFLTICCKNFRSWLSSGPVDVGGACKRAIIRNWGETDPYQWGVNNHETQVKENYWDLGNGALMRCLYPILRDNTLAAVEQAKLTHNNIINYEAIRKYSTLVKAALKGHNLTEYYHSERLVEPTGHVADTLKNASYWATHTDNFADSILGPVNHGGDADTIAAITGGITGALYGFNNIPSKWVNQLNPKVRKQLDSLVKSLCK